MIDTDDFLVKPGKAKLHKRKPDDTHGSTQSEAEREFKKLLLRLDDLQELLFAQGKHALLIVLQGMDTAGKDSTIRSVFGPLNVQGLSVASFKQPTPIELAHDFLWRVHQEAPPR